MFSPRDDHKCLLARRQHGMLVGGNRLLSRALHPPFFQRGSSYPSGGSKGFHVTWPCAENEENVLDTDDYETVRVGCGKYKE